MKDDYFVTPKVLHDFGFNSRAVYSRGANSYVLTVV